MKAIILIILIIQFFVVGIQFGALILRNTANELGLVKDDDELSKICSRLQIVCCVIAFFLMIVLFLV